MKCIKLIEDWFTVCPVCKMAKVKILNGEFLKCMNANCGHFEYVSEAIARDYSIKQALPKLFLDIYEMYLDDKCGKNHSKKQSVAWLYQFQRGFFSIVLMENVQFLEDFCQEHAIKSGFSKYSIKSCLSGLFMNVTIEEWDAIYEYFMNAEKSGVIKFPCITDDNAQQYLKNFYDFVGTTA